MSTDGSDCDHGSIRLGSSVDGEGVRRGRVEVCVNRAWGTVCDSLFTQDDADVVCTQLPGFKREGIYIHNVYYTVGPPYNENFGTVNIFHYSEVFIIERFGEYYGNNGWYTDISSL